MQITVTEAKARLTELIRRAEAGDEVLLTRNGHVAARLVPVMRRPDAAMRRNAITAARNAARPAEGPSAAHAADMLYNEDGLPG